MNEYIHMYSEQTTSRLRQAQAATINPHVGGQKRGSAFTCKNDVRSRFENHGTLSFHFYKYGWCNANINIIVQT